MKKPLNQSKSVTPPHAKNVNNSNIFSRFKSYFENTDQSKNSTVEHGRSMTEMLGVLAVIGVLSIGGIAGYQLSMNKLRANELMHEINVRRVALYQQFLKDPDNIDMELGNVTKHGYTITAETDPIEDDSFYINLENISQGICKQIINQNWTDPLDIYVNNKLTAENDASECNSSDTVSMSFKFDKYDSGETDNDYEQGNDNPNEATDQDEATKWPVTKTEWDQTGTDTTGTNWPQTGTDVTTTEWDQTTTCDDDEIQVDGKCYSCSQTAPIHGDYIWNLSGCSNRAISCGTALEFDCYSYLKSCPAGYTQTGSIPCKSGEIAINDGSDTYSGGPTGCCAR